MERKYEKRKSCGCIIIENNKVLLIIHQTKGHIEENETEFDTALKEVKEETNLDVEINIEKRYTEKYITDTGVEKEVVQKITYPTTKKLFQKVLKDINIKKY